MSDKEYYKTACIILVVVIGFILFWWYQSDHARMKRIEELKDEISDYEAKIEELESSVEFWKEEAGA